MIVLLLGVSGVGKTTIGRRLRDSSVKDIIYESSGKTKKLIIKELGVYKSLYDFNQIESLLVNQLYFERLKDIYIWGHKTVFVDTHASYPLQDGSFVNLLPTFKADDVILLNAPEKVVYDRRCSRQRSRDIYDLDSIKNELLFEEAFTQVYLRKNCVNGTMIDNVLSPTEVADKILSYLHLR